VTLLPLTDTHQHLWDRSRFRIPWLENAGELGRDHRPEEYVLAADGLNIARTVYMEVDVDPAQHRDEAAYVAGLCADPDQPMVAAVVGGRPAESGFAAYVDEVAAIGGGYVKGVRQVLHGGTPPGFCLTEDFVRGIELLGARGLSFDLCLRPGELADGAELARRCPGTRFILDHCGNAPVTPGADLSDWKRGIEAVAARPNVVACKVSGIVAGAKKGAWTPADLAPVVSSCTDAFGRDRVMFGGDWPVCTLAATLREWVEALQWIVTDWPKADQAALFAGNAARVYGLD
jgi:L-fuconolactonase